MNFNINMDDTIFQADKKEIDKLINTISILCNNKKGALIINIIIDSKKVQDYIIENIKNFKEELYIYDISQNKEDNLTELKNHLLTKSTCIINMKEYCENINNKYYNGAKTLNNIELYKSQVYKNINLLRDSFFLKNNVRCIFFFDRNEFNIFKSELADDFVSYSIRLDFNNLFYFQNQNINDYIIDQKNKRTKSK